MFAIVLFVLYIYLYVRVYVCACGVGLLLMSCGLETKEKGAVYRYQDPEN